MEPAELLKKIDELSPWHMQVDLGNGLYTPGVSEPENVIKILKKVYPEGLDGRSFLDAGCNCGGTCFLAKEFGAGRVLGVDVREHWIKQAEFLKTIIPSGVEFRMCHIGELELSEPYDIVLFCSKVYFTT